MGPPAESALDMRAVGGNAKGKGKGNWQKMTTLIGDIDYAAWQLGAPKAAKQMSIAAVKVNGRVPRIQLLPKSAMGAIYIPFAPSVYGGSGSEPRKSIVFSLPDDVRRGFEALEEWAREALRPTMPAIDALWHSAIKPATNYPAALRAKITLSGPGACPFYDDEGKPTEAPDEWQGRCAIPILEVRGLYFQKASAGLLLEVVGVMLGSARQHSAAATMEFM